MPKKKETKETAKTKELASVDQVNALMMAEETAKYTGFEDMSAEDLAIPFIGIIQKQSSDDILNLPGAKIGKFYNTVTLDIYEKIKVIPCGFKKVFVEWVLREKGGGFVAQHFDRSVLNGTMKDDLNRNITPAGTQIVETNMHYVILVTDSGDCPAVMAMKGTQIKKSRKWNSVMMNLKITHPKTGQMFRPPMYSHIYTFGTIKEEKNQNTWYGFNGEGMEQVTVPEQFIQAAQFNKDFTEGLVSVTPQMDEQEAPTVSEKENNIL